MIGIVQHNFCTRFTCIIIIMHKCGISSLTCIHHFRSVRTELVILCSCLHPISSVGKQAGAISLCQPTWLAQSSYWYHWRGRTKVATTAEICLWIGHPQTVSGDVVAEKVVKLREMVSFHAIAGNIVTGTAGWWSGRRWQSAVRFLVQFAIAQLHKATAQSA